MSQLPKCPTCSSEYTYEDGEMFVCPECAHEWAKAAAENANAVTVVRDAFGNELKAGDSITVIKDLKIKGSSVQDRRRRRNAAEIGIRQEGMSQ